MEMHEGSVSLTLLEDIRVLDGTYYTGRGRQTHGTMRFAYSAPELLRRFRE